MKKIITLFIATLFSMQLVSAQKTDTSIYHSPQDLHNFYMQKHKTNQIIGWSCLGAGIGLTAVGVVTIQYHLDKGIFPFFIGIATAFLSIHFFNAARRNKTKARLALKSENVSFGNKILNRFNYSAIAFTVPL